MKRILIVGATSAIAEAVARLWAANGAQLFLIGRNGSHLERIAADLELRGARDVRIAQFDAMDCAQYPALIDQAWRIWGGIDIALVAHGFLPDQAACESDFSLVAKVYQINVLSATAFLMALAPRFREQGRGTLAVISSVAGDRGRPGNYVYGSAKAALSRFCEGMRVQLYRRGVALVDIRPGVIETPMTAGHTYPQLLVSTPQRIAAAVERGIDTQRPVLYVPGRWRWIMLVVRVLPFSIFKRLNF